MIRGSLPNDDPRLTRIQRLHLLDPYNRLLPLALIDGCENASFLIKLQYPLVGLPVLGMLERDCRSFSSPAPPLSRRLTPHYMTLSLNQNPPCPRPDRHRTVLTFVVDRLPVRAAWIRVAVRLDRLGLMPTESGLFQSILVGLFRVINPSLPRRKPIPSFFHPVRRLISPIKKDFIALGCR
jgi:hypothetical protein